MSVKINITNLTPEHHQALACMYYAKMPSSDPRYKGQKECFTLFQSRFNRKYNAYKNIKDTFDYFFENGRKGWKNTPLKSRGQACVDVYNQYGDYDLDLLEIAVNEIIELYSTEKISFVSMKCGIPETVHQILGKKKNITVDGVYTLSERLVNGNTIFVTAGGDTGKSEVDWDPGFVGLARVIREPYEYGYNNKPKYFKFDMEMLVLFGTAYKRKDFINYEDAFDAPYIGPELSRDPSQAISTISDEKAVAVIRAVLDKEPSLRTAFENIFPADFMNRVLGAVKKLVSVMVSYGEEVREAVNEQLIEQTEVAKDLCYYTKIKPAIKLYNKILFGAPGTGKSHTLEGDRKELLYGHWDIDEDMLKDLSQYGSYERVTFHPDYSYANFVGTYKPVPKKDVEGNDIISYEYVAGPFIRTLVKALQSGRTENPKPYLLIIEEINRANAAAVFGDVFQLLDRKDGASEYSIQTSKDLREFLAKDENLGGSPDDYAEIRIPDNMFIWATMNSADQGVYPMDTAFKRRWDFKYIGIDDGENADAIKDKYELIIETDQKTSQKINWNNLRKAINKTLEDGYQVNEDKLMGPFFISPAVLTDESFKDAFKNKVLMYLCEDVLRHRCGEKLFEKIEGMTHLSYAKVCKAFDKKGIDIFVKEVRDKAVVTVSEKNDKTGDAE